MVKKWGQLGFISKVQSAPNIYVEDERRLPHSGTYTIYNIGQKKFVGQKLTSATDVKPIVVVDGIDKASTARPVSNSILY